jgi:hypothetical protein
MSYVLLHSTAFLIAKTERTLSGYLYLVAIPVRLHDVVYGVPAYAQQEVRKFMGDYVSKEDRFADLSLTKPRHVVVQHAREGSKRA